MNRTLIGPLVHTREPLEVVPVVVLSTLLALPLVLLRTPLPQRSRPTRCRPLPTHRPRPLTPANLGASAAAPCPSAPHTRLPTAGSTIICPASAGQATWAGRSGAEDEHEEADDGEDAEGGSGGERRLDESALPLMALDGHVVTTAARRQPPLLPCPQRDAVPDEPRVGNTR